MSRNGKVTVRRSPGCATLRGVAQRSPGIASSTERNTNINNMKRLLSTLLLSSLALPWGATSFAVDPAALPAPKHSVSDVPITPEQEVLVKGAVKWLASRQQPNGSWVGGINSTAFTSYALMAFMAAGHLPNEGEYGKNVARGLKYVLDSCRPDGYIAAPNDDIRMYGHGIATIALGEIYGQTRDPTIRPKLAKAVKLIVDCQNHEGGWRYKPVKADADISVTVLQVVALRVAKNSGIDVPQSTIDAAVGYVRKCYNKDQGGFSYQPGGKVGFARTAAAIYSLQVCGQYDDPLVAAGSKYLFDKWTADREWYTYGTFYAAPAQYMIGGQTWKTWYTKTTGELAKFAQRERDTVFWRPIGGNGQNDVYATSVYTMLLAMPYHYVPLYQR
jgi:squalene cyclase